MKWYEHLELSSLQPAIYPTKEAIECSERNTRHMSALGTARKAGFYGNTIPTEALMHVHGPPKPPSSSMSPTNIPSKDPTLADTLISKQDTPLFDRLKSHFGTDKTRRFVMTSKHLPGLLETEKINYRIVNSSSSVRIVDLNTNFHLKMIKENVSKDSSLKVDNEIASLTKGIQTRFEFERKRAFMPAQSKNVGLMEPRSANKSEEMFKSLAEMYVLDCHNKFVEKQQFQNDPPNASSPFSCEEQEIEGEDVVEFESEVDLSPKSMKMEVDTATLIDPKTLASAFKRPPLYFLELDSTLAANCIQITIDLQVPTLLTDIVIPSNEIFTVVTVDGYLQKHSTNVTRFAYSTEIERRSLVLNDIEPTQIVRYLKISFITRESRKSKVHFMPGNFYGLRCFSPWQAYKFNDSDSLKRMLEMVR